MYWLNALDCLSILLSQTPAPSAAVPLPTQQIELFTQQIEFLQDANSRMATSFGQFVTLINAIVVVIGVFIGILGFRTRQEIKQSLDEMVRHEVNKQIAQTVQAKVDEIDRVVQREALVGQTRVAYLLLNPSVDPVPDEYQLLKARGFQMAVLPYDRDRRFPDAHVIVLDLINTTLPAERQDKLTTAVSEKTSAMRPHSAVLVIYVKGHRDVITNLPKERYYIPVNGRVALVGAVTDAAQVAYALRKPAL